MIIHVILRVGIIRALNESACDFLGLLERQQESGIDTIKYHTYPRIPNGKVTKSQ